MFNWIKLMQAEIPPRRKAQNQRRLMQINVILDWSLVWGIKHPLKVTRCYISYQKSILLSRFSPPFNLPLLSLPKDPVAVLFPVPFFDSHLCTLIWSWQPHCFWHVYRAWSILNSDFNDISSWAAWANDLFGCHQSAVRTQQLILLDTLWSLA